MKQTLMLTVVASLACAPALQAGAVPEWSLIAQNSIVAVGQKFPGEAAVYMGIVHAAIYDAAVAVSGGYEPYRVSPVVPPGASLDAAVATAAHRVLVALFPLQEAASTSAYEASLAGIPDGQPKTDGIAAGEQVGAGFLDLPAIEGLNSHGALRPAATRPRGLRADREPRRRSERSFPWSCRWPSKWLPSSGPTARCPSGATRTQPTSSR